MRVRVIAARELTQDLRDAWTSIQRSRTELSSPYFTPGFADAAAQCSDGVRIGVIEDGGRWTGDSRVVCRRDDTDEVDCDAVAEEWRHLGDFVVRENGKKARRIGVHAAR